MRYSILILVAAMSCGPGYKTEAFKKLSYKEQQKFQKYLIQGRDLYSANCITCHQKDGQGLRKLIPPLAGSNYLKDNQAESARLIRNGAKESIEVNGIAYPPTMPANYKLTVLEIAELLTYINNSWGNEFGFVDATQIKTYLD